MKGTSLQPVQTLRQHSKRLFAGVPIDLVGVAGFVIVAALLLAVVDISSPVFRAAVGVPLLFLVPGYVTVSMLFPRAKPIENPAALDAAVLPQTRSLSDVERVALSFGVSVAVLPLFGLALSLTSPGITAPTVVGAISAFALTGAGIAAGRRLAVPPTDRYRIHLGRRVSAARSAIFETDSRAQLAVNVILVCSLLLAMTTVGYALIAPQEGEEYTSLQLLTETDDGELVAADYPDEIEPGESIPLVIAVENNERESTDYTAVVQQQTVEDGEVVDRTELETIDYALADGESGYADRAVTPTADDGTVRVAVLLYDDSDAPDTPTTDNAYRYTYFWTDVTDEA